ncbi:hypothetical protein Taro_002937 [Colocasia esculenta]|uniref:2-oxoadipate dioxygenase/decarboxylase n=1 Tax=Colocasia esculenta TaxID=4460 RepID=A0A843TIH5_COLES|nr:hypothetical protein [Colocasia esculenta]
MELVAVALSVALLSRRPRRARQHLVCLGCFSGRGWRVGAFPRAGVPLGPSCGNVTGWLAAFSDRRWLAFQQGLSVSCRRVLLLLLGARAANVVAILLVLRLVSSSACASVWVAEVVVALFRCGPASPSHCLALRWFRSRVGRLNVGPQLGRAAVVGSCSCWDSLASLYRGGWRQESAAGELEVGRCVLLLAACGVDLVVLAVTEFLTLFPTLWRSEVVVPVVRRSFSQGCSVFSRGGTWLFLPDLVEVGDVGACVVTLVSCGGSGVPSLLPLSLEFLLLWLEFVVGRLWWRFVAPCVASSVSCERERLYRSELRVAFLQVLGEVIKNYTKLSGSGSNYAALASALGTLTWDRPSYSEYQLLLRESEYAAWTLVNGYALNHVTISTHRLQSHIRDINNLNKFIEDNGYKLNSEGGILKVSPDGLLLQSSTVADSTVFLFADGITETVPCSYIEFAERLLLPQYKNLPKQEVQEHLRRDGFEVGNADKIFESTSKDQLTRNAA